MPIDNRTATRNYPLPDLENLQTEDIPRFIEALDGIDLDISGILTALAGKSNNGHGHIISDVTGLQTALDGKAATTFRPPLADLTDVDFTGGAVNGQYLRRIAGKWSPATPAINHVTGLQDALDSKASVIALAALSDVVAGKASSASVTALSDAMTSALAGKVDLGGNSIIVPSGNTAGRPAAPSTPRIRFNSETGEFEGFNTSTSLWGGIGGGNFVGPTVGTATGGQTSVTVSYTPGKVLVFRGGAYQAPGVDVTVTSGTAVVFATPMTAGEEYVIYPFSSFVVANALKASLNLSDLPAPDTALANLGGNADGRDIFKNASTLGATLAKIADAAAGRAAIGAPPLPTASAGGPGHWFPLQSSLGSALVLPTGGTWAWWAFCATSPGGVISSVVTCGINAGATQVAAAVSGTVWTGLGWRLA